MDANLYKNARQIEFCELMQKMKERGFRAADVARLLKIKPPSVSRILAGGQTPRQSTLDLFRRVVADQGSTAEPLQDQLRQLKASDPAGFEVIAAMIRTLLRKAGGAAAVNYPSTVEYPAAFAETHVLLEKAEKMADAEIAAEDAAALAARSPATTEPKSPPPSAVSARTRKQPAPQNPQTK
jgi:predicted transcriptional regulator